MLRQNLEILKLFRNFLSQKHFRAVCRVILDTYWMFRKVNRTAMKFGIESDGIDNFLKRYSFKHIYKKSTKEMRDEYFHGDNKQRKVSKLFNFVRATT